MAKHIYYIPLQETLKYIKEHKSTFRNLLVSKKKLEYNKLLGKSYFSLQIEAFIKFFHIDKEVAYALHTFEYYNKKDFFMHFVIYMQKVFLHFHATLNTQTQTHIDYIEMSHTLAKSKNMVLKESFGEDDAGSFFKILLDAKLVIDEKGKLIKTLRKKAYKKRFYVLIEWDEVKNNEKYLQI